MKTTHKLVVHVNVETQIRTDTKAYNSSMGVYLCDGLADGHLTRSKVDADRLALPPGSSFLHSFWHCSCEQKHLQISVTRAPMSDDVCDNHDG